MKDILFIVFIIEANRNFKFSIVQKFGRLWIFNSSYNVNNLMFSKGF